MKTQRPFRDRRAGVNLLMAIGYRSDVITCVITSYRLRGRSTVCPSVAIRPRASVGSWGVT
jgi:hypothetical protein